MLEEELASARAATKTQAEDFEYKLEREKESASRLQGTIDHLQGKIAKAEQEKTALIEENQSWSEQVKLLQEQWGSQRERHSGQLEDLAGSVASLRAERSALNEQVTTLIEDKMALQEELRAIKARQDMAQR
jgi:chromosome segregation ATPase